MPSLKSQMKKSKKPGKIIIYVAFLALGASGLGACVKGLQRPYTPATTETGKTTAGGVPGYAQIKAIVEQRCVSCHMGLHKTMGDYAQLKARVDSGILYDRVVVLKNMPMKPSQQYDAITEEERALIGAWAKAGGPMEAPAESVANTDTAPVAVPPVVSAEPAPAPAILTADDHLRNCIGCHGEKGQRIEGMVGTPNLAGLGKAYLVKQLTAFKKKDPALRPGSLMEGLIEAVPESDLEFLANYFDLYPNIVEGKVVPPQEVDPIKFDKGQAAAAVCVACHSEKGLSPVGGPPLSGQAADYISAQLQAFKAGTRKDPMMFGVAMPLDEATIEALGYYYSLAPYYKK